MSEPEKKPLIQVLERALDVLELLARENRPLRVADIAEHLGIGQNSAHNLVRTLYNRGYLAQEASRLYALGPQCFYLGSFADRWGWLREAASPVLRELSRETGDLSFVGVIENRKLFCVALAEGESEVTAPSQRWAEELYDTASGRLLLAFLPEPERRRIIEKFAADAAAAAVIDTLCARIRDERHAVIVASDPPMTALAVPVTDRRGRIVAALGRTCHDPGLDLPAAVAVLNRYALRITARLPSPR